jgi:SAM-dependent methyltransferase
MSQVTRDHLAWIYRDGDDPWNFRTSRYELEKFRATRSALTRARYAEVMEVGCGNGELGRHLTGLSDRYVGVDAVPSALAAAQSVLPEGEFHELFLPAELPAGDFDLIVLSEFLYFLDPPSIASLAAQLDRRWPAAELLCVTYRGETGNALSGEEALELFRTALNGQILLVRSTESYRIDVRPPQPIGRATHE